MGGAGEPALHAADIGELPVPALVLDLVNRGVRQRFILYAHNDP